VLVFRLALRALAWRAAASITVFAIALVAILAAAVGPIYLHAVDQTVLTQRLLQAPQKSRDINVNQTTLIGTDADWHVTVRSISAEASDKRWFAPPVFTEEAQVYYDGYIRSATQLAAVDGLCRHVRVVAGRCLTDNSTNETVISARTARSQHLAVGGVIKPLPVANVARVPLRIVGVIEPIAVHGSYWEPWDLFNATPNIFDNQLPRLDSFFVSHVALASRLKTVAQTVSADVRLKPADVHLDDLPALRALVRQVTDEAAALRNKSLTDTVVGSQLGRVLDGMRTEMSLSRTLIVLPTVQLVLLAIFVLYAVVAGTTAVQGPEVALAKLRGRRPRSVLFQGIVQPVVLILLAAPIATLLAWLLIRIVARHLLGSATAVVLPSSAVAVVAAATGGGILAALIAARRIVVSPVGALLRRGADQNRTSAGVAVADAAAVTLALAGLVQLIAGGVLDSGSTDPLSALAPTLLGVALAIVVLRLLPFGGRLVVRWTRSSRRLATFLAVRQIVRRPAGARVMLLVGVALALATFAVTNWSVAGRNREVRAVNEAGADTVLDVQPGDDVYDLRTAVDAADAHGHSMAAAFVQADRSTPLIAVDTHRFAGVAAWRGGYSSTPLPTLLSALTPREHAPIAFKGTDIRLRVNLSTAPRGRVSLTLYITGADHRRSSYVVDALHRGAGTYRKPLPPVCTIGCRVTGLDLIGPDITTSNGTAPPPVEATVALDALSAGRWRPVTGFNESARWRNDGQGSAEIGNGGPALRLRLQLTSAGGDWPTLTTTDVPTHLPAVLGSETASSYPGPAIHDASSFGLDEETVPLDGVATAVALPQVDRFGAMVDFGLALSAMREQSGGGVHYQVWTDGSAPKDLAARLAARHVRVVDVVRSATYRTVLDHSGPAFADGLFLVAAAAATLLALGATVLGGIITARRRAYELAALEAVGVSRRTLRRSTAAEQGVLLGTGIVVGLVAGLGGSVLALPSTPFFVDESIGPPREHALPYGLLGLLLAALLVAAVLTCVAVSRLVSRQATAGRLREAQQ
jgi:putative ABC transport system permease protein